MLTGNRNVQIRGDLQGNVIITGDSNRVFLIQSSRTIDVTPSSKRLRSSVNPYKGLHSFQETDAEFFFGREGLTQDLWTRLRDLCETQPEVPFRPRLLPILGPSGSG